MSGFDVKLVRNYRQLWINLTYMSLSGGARSCLQLVGEPLWPSGCIDLNLFYSGTSLTGSEISEAYWELQILRHHISRQGHRVQPSSRQPSWRRGMPSESVELFRQPLACAFQVADL